MKTRIVLVIIVAVLLIGSGFVLTGNTVKDDTKPIKMGFFGPESGPVSYTGQPVRTSFQLAHEQNSIVNGKKIEVFYEDDKCDPKEALSAAHELIDVKGVDILISGVCSSSTLAVAPLAQEKKIILISPVAATPKLTDAGEYVYRISSSSKLIAEKATELIKSLGYKKIGIIYENNEYPAGWEKVFKESFQKAGGEILVEEAFNSADKDIRTQLKKVDESNPDALLFIALSVPVADLMIKQSKELGIKTQIIGSEIFSYKPIVEKEESNGIIVINYNANLGSEKMKKFLIDYKTKYGKLLNEETFGSFGFDLYNILYKAIKECDSGSSECIKKQLDNLGEFEGASGKFHLDQNGDGIREFKAWRVENKKLVDI